MRYAALIFLSLILYSCSENKEKTNGDPASANATLVKYPLPTTNDSLQELLKTLPDDTNKVNVLNAVFIYYLGRNLDSAESYASRAVDISQKLGWQKGIAKSTGNLGIAYNDKGNQVKSLENYFIAIKIDSALNNKEGIARWLMNIGIDYYLEGDYVKALEFFLKAEKLNESTNNEKLLGATLSNLGSVYNSLHDHKKAIGYFFRAAKLDEKNNSRKSLAKKFGNIGLTYWYLSNDKLGSSDTSGYRVYADSAILFLNKALVLNKEFEQIIGLSINATNLGNVYFDQKDYTTALNYYNESVKYDKEANDLDNLASHYSNIGSLFMEQGEFKKAHDILIDAMRLADSTAYKELQLELFKHLSALYQRANILLPDTSGQLNKTMEQMRLQSLNYFKKSVALQDSLFSEENKKQLVRKEMNYEFDKKEAVTKAENDKKTALAKEQLTQKEKERNYFIAGFALVLLLAGFIFRGYKQKQKANEIISHQKAVVEEKQKEILDSIRYAKRIQQSLLPSERYISRFLDR